VVGKAEAELNKIYVRGGVEIYETLTRVRSVSFAVALGTVQMIYRLRDRG